MFTIDSIFQILITLTIISFILYGLISKFKISSIKVMLFGISLIVFSNSVLKGMIQYGIDDVVSVIGLSFCIAGFVKTDNIK